MSLESSWIDRSYICKPHFFGGGAGGKRGFLRQISPRSETGKEMVFLFMLGRTTV